MEFIDKVTARTFKQGVVANEYFKKAYMFFASKENYVGMIELDWDEFENSTLVKAETD